MVMVSKFSNFPDKSSENNELKDYELSGSECSTLKSSSSFKENTSRILLLPNSQSSVRLRVIPLINVKICRNAAL